jgi:hypothetical protein
MNQLAQKGDFLDILLRSKKTVFSVRDAALLWGDSNIGAIKVRFHSYVKNKKLIRLRQGVYVKDLDYDKYELATHILRPSYVSFETVLIKAGINFQYYSQIFAASYTKREIICDGTMYKFFAIKRSVLINPAGIDQRGEYSIATPERAFLDTIYRSKDYHFDNMEPLSWEKVFDILPIYENKKMNKKVDQYYKWHKSEQ